MGCKLLRSTVKIVEVEYETDIMSNALVTSELKGWKAVSWWELFVV